MNTGSGILRYIAYFVIALAGLTTSSDLHAQYQWRVILPSRIDSTFYRALFGVSCHGERCIASTAVFAKGVGNAPEFFTSNDGGLTWTPLAVEIPIFKYHSPNSRSGLTYDAVQQIDPLTTVLGSSHGLIVTTTDGWQTWRVDSSLPNASRVAYFKNAAEGMMWAAFGFFRSTVDSGKTWKLVIFSDRSSTGRACQSYGDSTFRVFDDKNRIFTTRDNWSSWDTTIISLNGPLVDTSFHTGEFVFGPGDTVAIFGWRWDATSTNQASMAFAMSTDLGRTWTESDMPRQNGIYFGSTKPRVLNWDHLVFAGRDSVGRILQSFDRGATWQLDTVPFSNKMPYNRITEYTTTSWGRVIAGVADNTSFLGSASLVYLERTTARVGKPTEASGTALYPNPTTKTLNLPIQHPALICDALGRQYRCPQNGDQLDVSSLPAGVYYLRQGTYHTQFVKQ